MDNQRIVYEPAARRAIEVTEGCGPLVAAIEKLGVDVVSIEGRLLLRGDPDALYVCVAMANRQDAFRLLFVLIEEALTDTALRDALTNSGHPRLSEIGAKCLVWWPELHGHPVTIQ